MDIRRGDAAKSAARETYLAKEDGLFRRLGLWHMDGKNRQTVDHPSLDPHADGVIKRTVALRGEICGDLLGIGHADGNIGSIKGLLVAAHAQQNPAAPEARFVRKRRDGLEDRIADRTGGLGLDGGLLAQSVELLEKILRCHGTVRYSVKLATISVNVFGWCLLKPASSTETKP